MASKRAKTKRRPGHAVHPRAAGRHRRRAPAVRDSTTPARPLREDLVTQAALEAYGAVRHEGRLADRALDFTLRARRQLHSAERRAVAERVYALLRRQRTVDWVLERVYAPFPSLPATEQDLLRLCASRFLHGEPARAVTESAHLGHERAQALGRIHDALADLQRLPLEERFAIQVSIPDFLARRFLDQLGAEAEAALSAMNGRAPLVARANTLLTDRDRLVFLLREQGIDCRPTALSPLGVVLQTRVNAFSVDLFKQGLFELQDEGSQLLGIIVDPPPTRVVDACAGAGGKTLQLAAAMRNRGELFAFDVDSARLDDLRKRTRRAGVHNTRVRAIPFTGEEAVNAVADLVGKADRVLVDAPCSGTGTFRRKPDARYRITPQDLVIHSQRQRELLSRFSALVKPGGRLIYGTCSILREENEAVVEDFLRAHPDFALRPAAEDLPTGMGEQVTENGLMKLFPHRHGTDGFFGAILVRAK
ncbi:MAG TPA: methyltransferase domain-containing protein [Myxococcaceae bacterium]|nr:methyltransferase domain-containing protein [Myxococcaceae bacterium]